MANENIQQIFTGNPAASMVSTDLFYLGRSPYGITNDMAITWTNVMGSITTFSPSATWNGNIISPAFGGTGINNGTNTLTVNANSTINQNVSTTASPIFNNVSTAVTSTASSAGTITLTSASSRSQVITGSTTEIIQLPNATTLTIGWRFEIDNNSSGIVTVNDGVGSLLFTMPAGSYQILTNLSIGSPAGSWDHHGLLPAAFRWGTSTFPSSVGASGTILTSNGTGWINSVPTYTSSYAINSLLFASAANVVTGLGTSNSALLNTNSSGVPAWVTSPVVSAASSGSQVSLTVKNTSNTSSSSAKIVAQVGGTSSGNAIFQLTDGTNFWSTFLDESDVQTYKLANSQTRMRVSPTGQINYPTLSCFQAFLSTPQNNVTGDGTTYIIPFDTVTGGSGGFDQNSNFNTSTGIFTAPETGIYIFGTVVSYDNVIVANTLGNVEIVTSGFSYKIWQGNIGSLGSGPNINGITLAMMTEGDTANIATTVSGSTKTVNIFGDSNPESYFFGRLVA